MANFLSLSGSDKGMAAPSNNVIVFDGSNDVITAAGTGLGANATSYTVMAWIKPSAIDDTQNQILWERKSDSTGNIPFGLSIGAANKLRFEITGGSIVGNTVLAVGKWYHAAAVRNAATAKLEIYLNGNSDKTPNAYTEGDATATTPTLYIGSKVAAGSAFPGSIKDPRIFNVALSAAQIALFANGYQWEKLPSGIYGVTATDASQVRFYKFDTVTNVTINDAGAIIDSGNDASNGTGANFAGTSASGVATDTPVNS